MHLSPGCFKYVSTNVLTRSNVIRHAHLLKNDSFHLKNITSTLSGQFLHKDLHTIPRLHCALLVQEKGLTERSNDYEQIVILPYEWLDESNKTVLYKNLCHMTVIKINEFDKASDIYWEEFPTIEEFKNAFGRSLYHYDTRLNRLAAKQLLSAHVLNDIVPCSHSTLENSLGSLSMEVDNNPVKSSSENVNKSSQGDDKSGRPSEEQLLKIKSVLCSSILSFFHKPTDFSIYHKDIVFQNNIRNLTTRGLTAYVNQMYLIRLCGRFHYAAIKVDILKITHHIEDGTVRVRWRVNGLSRRKIFFLFGKLRNRTWQTFYDEESEWLDGFSVFSLDRDGFVYKHVCDKMIPDDEELAAKASSFRTRLLTLLRLPRRPSPSSMQAMLTYSALPQNNCSFKLSGKKSRL